MTFTGLIQRAFDKLTPERMQEKIDTQAEKLVDDTLSDVFRPYSDFGKVLKAALVDALRVESLDLPSYGHVVSQILARQIQARVSEVVAAKLEEDMESLLKLAPKEAKLSGLIAELLDGNSWEDGPTRVGLLIDGDDDYSHVWVYLDKDGRLTDKYAADIRLLVGLEKKFGDYERGEPIAGTISTGTVKGTDLKKDTRFGYGTTHKNHGTQFGAWFGFEQKILAMYACGTIITLDEDDCILDKFDY